MLVEDLDTQLWSRQDEADSTDDEAHYEAVARPMTASCVDASVDAIVRRATDHLEVVAEPSSPARSCLQEAVSNAGAAIVTPMARSTVSHAPAMRARGRRGGFGVVGVQSGHGVEITRLLAAPRCAAEVRAYVASAGGGFGRVPSFLRPVVASLDSEQRYILSLVDPREAPRNRVRVLPTGERERSLRMLQQQLQKASAMFAQESILTKLAYRKRGSGEQASTLDEVARLKEEVAFLDRPFVFVEVSAAGPQLAVSPRIPQQQPQLPHRPQPPSSSRLLRQPHQLGKQLLSSHSVPQ